MVSEHHPPISERERTNALVTCEVEWNVQVNWRSCVWTSARRYGVASDMDDDTSDLLFQLCTRIGMIMEDAAPLALSRPGADAESRLAHVNEIQGAAARICALVAAAKSLL